MGLCLLEKCLWLIVCGLLPYSVPISSSNPPYTVGDCCETCTSYTYGGKVICYWLNTSILPLGVHCGSDQYAWIPDEGADYIIGQLIEDSWPGGVYHTGYTLTYTPTTNLTVTSYNGRTQNYSNFQTLPHPTNSCIGYQDGYWIPYSCIVTAFGVCSYVMNFTYGDCTVDGVGYFDGINIFCYYIEETAQTSTAACSGIKYGLIESIHAQRVVNWLLHLRELPYEFYNLGYSQIGTETAVTTHDLVPQSWTNWDDGEPNSNNDECVALVIPYGKWLDHNCDYPRPSICSTVTKAVQCPDPISMPFASIIRLTGYIYGDVVTYVCHTGYNLTAGALTGTCTASGTWTDIPPICSRVVCPEPEPGGYFCSLLSNSGNEFLYGDEIIYRCHDGYHLFTGNLLRKCQANGTWSGTQPSCEVDVITTTDLVTTTTDITEWQTTTKLYSTEPYTSGTPTQESQYLTTLATCECQCIHIAQNLTSQEIQERVENLKTELTVDKTVLSSTIRALTSADDPRPSSAYLGYVGIIIIVVVPTIVVVFDALNFLSMKGTSVRQKV